MKHSEPKEALIMALGPGTAATKARSQALGALKHFWVAVKELKLSYFTKETPLFTIYIYIYIPLW